jgi:hypothetical protein
MGRQGVTHQNCDSFLVMLVLCGCKLQDVATILKPDLLILELFPWDLGLKEDLSMRRQKSSSNIIVQNGYTYKTTATTRISGRLTLNMFGKSNRTACSGTKTEQSAKYVTKSGRSELRHKFSPSTNAREIKQFPRSICLTYAHG